MKFNFILKKGLWEQAFNSLLNFLIVVIFSNSLSVKDFSEFIIIFTGINLSFLISTSLWSAPILVFLPTKYLDYKKSYLLFLITVNTITSSIIGILIFSIMVYFFSWILIQYAVFSILIGVIWSNFELVRKYCYSLEKMNLPLIGSGCLIVLFLFLTHVFNSKFNLNFSLIVLFLIYSITVVLLSVLSFNKNYGTLKNNNIFSRKLVIKNHWSYSKWTLIGNICYWGYSQGYFVLISKYVTDLQLGALRSAINILGLVTIVLALFENSYTPKASKVYYYKGIIALKNFVSTISKKYFLSFCALVAFVSIIVYFGFSLLYGDKYSDYKYLTLILGIYELLLGINRPYIVGLRAINYTKPFFIGNLFTALVTSGLGMILSSYLSVFGSALSMIITTLFLSLYYILQHNKEVNLRIREEQERILTI